jgi:hypothetical protein
MAGESAPPGGFRRVRRLSGFPLEAGIMEPPGMMKPPPMPPPTFHEHFDPVGASAGGTNAGATAYPELSDERLQSNFTLLSLSGQLALARTYLSPLHVAIERGQELQLIQRCVQGLSDGMRVQGRTAYVSRSASVSTNTQHGGGGSRRAASITDQAAAVVLMLLGKVISDGAATAGTSSAAIESIQSLCSTLLLEKLANWLAMGGASSGRGMVATDVALALSAYDYDMSSTADAVATSSISVLVASGMHDLLLHTFGEGVSTRKNVVSTTTQVSASWAELMDNSVPLGTASANRAATSLPPLVFATRGEGELSVAASLRFTPLHLRRDPVDRGIAVEKSIKLLGNMSSVGGDSDSGASIRIARGERVEVTVQVRLTDDATGSATGSFLMGSSGSAVEVVDWLPGGLEVLDPLLFDSASSDASAASSNWHSRWRNWYSDWCMAFGFGAFETLDRSRGVRWTASNAEGGRTYTMSYQALATTTGCFSVPPTMAKVVEEEEVMGMSAAGAVEVVGGAVSEDAHGAFSCTDFHMTTIPDISSNGSSNGISSNGISSNGAKGRGDDGTVATSESSGTVVVLPPLLAEGILQLRIPAPTVPEDAVAARSWSWVERQAVVRMLAWELGVDYGRMVVLTERRRTATSVAAGSTSVARWVNVTMGLGLYVVNHSEASAFHTSLASCVSAGTLQTALQQYHAARMATESVDNEAGFGAVLTSTSIGSSVVGPGIADGGGNGGGGSDVEVVETEASVKDKAKTEEVHTLISAAAALSSSTGGAGEDAPAAKVHHSLPLLLGGVVTMLALTMLARAVKRRTQHSAHARARSVQLAPFFGVNTAAASAAPLDSVQQHRHLAQDGPSEHDALTSDEDDEVC